MAFAWPLAALAQRGTIPFIGFLNSGSPNERAHLVDAFRQGLKEGGYVDGKDVAIEYRWAEGRLDRLPRLATELANRRVAVIVTTGGMVSAVAAKSVTTTIPIVFTGGEDPVKLGLVASLSRPGGNVTGSTNISTLLHAKRLQILHELMPGAEKFAYLVNRANLNQTQSSIREVEDAAKSTSIKVDVLYASGEAEIDSAFSSLKKTGANALLVGDQFVTQRDQIVALAARHQIPACYGFREFAIAGGLLSYGPDLAHGYRQAGMYTARILKGAKPADLPVMQASKIELVVNLKAAKALGLTISRDFLARVDEVIQ